VTRWTAIIPVKSSEFAKSRIRLPAPERRTLADAFARDVMAAVGASKLVGTTVVVTGRDDFPGPTDDRSVVVLQDSPIRTSDGLNAAIEIGRIWALSHHPERPVVVVPADLPCLTTNVLDATLRRLGGVSRAFTPDARGSGTTLLSASAPDLLCSAYGPDSRHHHTLLESTVFEDVDRRVRHDVDTLRDLAGAVQIGVGSRTKSALDRVRPRSPGPRSPVPGPRTCRRS